MFLCLKAHAKIHVAVLPFKNNSGEEYEWAANAIADTLVSKLSSAEALRFIERVHIDEVLKQTQKEDELYQQLGVQYLLTGSYVIHKDKVQIFSRIIQTKNAKIVKKSLQVTSGEFNELLELQNQLAIKVSKQLPVILTTANLKGYQATNLGSYVMFQKAKNALAQGHYKAAIDLFLKAQASNDQFFQEAHYLEGKARIAFINEQKKQEEKKAITESYIDKFERDAGEASFAFFNLGRVYQANGEYHKAIESYQSFLRWVHQNEKMVRWELDLKPYNDNKKLKHYYAAGVKLANPYDNLEGSTFRHYQCYNEQYLMTGSGNKVIRLNPKNGEPIYAKSLPERIYTLTLRGEFAFVLTVSHYYLIRLDKGDILYKHKRIDSKYKRRIFPLGPKHLYLIQEYKTLEKHGVHKDKPIIVRSHVLNLKEGTLTLKHEQKGKVKWHSQVKPTWIRNKDEIYINTLNIEGDRNTYQAYSMQDGEFVQLIKAKDLEKTFDVFKAVRYVPKEHQRDYRKSSYSFIRQVDDLVQIEVIKNRPFSTRTWMVNVNTGDYKFMIPRPEAMPWNHFFYKNDKHIYTRIVNGGRVYEIQKYDRKSGELLWRKALPTSTILHGCTPLGPIVANNGKLMQINEEQNTQNVKYQVWANYYLGQTYLKLNQLENAEMTFKRCLLIDSSFYEANGALFQIYKNKEKTFENKKRALIHANAFLNSHKKDRSSLSEAWKYLQKEGRVMKRIRGYRDFFSENIFINHSRYEVHDWNGRVIHRLKEGGYRLGRYKNHLYITEYKKGHGRHFSVLDTKTGELRGDRFVSYDGILFPTHGSDLGYAISHPFVFRVVNGNLKALSVINPKDDWSFKLGDELLDQEAYRGVVLNDTLFICFAKKQELYTTDVYIVDLKNKKLLHKIKSTPKVYPGKRTYSDPISIFMGEYTFIHFKYEATGYIYEEKSKNLSKKELPLNFLVDHRKWKHMDRYLSRASLYQCKRHEKIETCNRCVDRKAKNTFVLFDSKKGHILVFPRERGNRNYGDDFIKYQDKYHTVGKSGFIHPTSEQKNLLYTLHIEKDDILPNEYYQLLLEGSEPPIQWKNDIEILDLDKLEVKLIE